MEVYLSIVIFIFGILFGSFFNVVGYRLPKGLSLIHPGSFCPKCNQSLKKIKYTDEKPKYVSTPSEKITIAIMMPI